MYSKSYGRKKYKMSPTTKFLLGFNNTLILNVGGTTGGWTDTMTVTTTQATSTPANLYGLGNTNYPVINPQIIGGFMLKSCIFRQQGNLTTSVALTNSWGFALVKVENSLAANKTSFPNVSINSDQTTPPGANSITTFYQPEENVIFFF